MRTKPTDAPRTTKPHNYAQDPAPERGHIADGIGAILDDAQEPDDVTPGLHDDGHEPDAPEPEPVMPKNRTPVPFALPDATGDTPDWVKIPPGMRFPRNKQVIFVRFPAAMTDTPGKGERQAIVWSNSLGDNRIAYGRAGGDMNAASEELTKQTVRAVDGVVADWTGEPGAGNIDAWWEAIGPKCRQILDRIFVQLHVASPDEAKYFLESCVAVRVVGG